MQSGGRRNHPCGRRAPGSGGGCAPRGVGFSTFIVFAKLVPSYRQRFRPLRLHSIRGLRASFCYRKKNWNRTTFSSDIPASTVESSYRGLKVSPILGRSLSTPPPNQASAATGCAATSTTALKGGVQCESTTRSPILAPVAIRSASSNPSNSSVSALAELILSVVHGLRLSAAVTIGRGLVHCPEGHVGAVILTMYHCSASLTRRDGRLAAFRTKFSVLFGRVHGAAGSPDAPVEQTWAMRTAESGAPGPPSFLRNFGALGWPAHP